MTRAGEVFTWKLELKPTGAPDTAFATVFSGDIDRTGATGPHQGTGAFTLDLDALHAVTSLDVAGKLGRAGHAEGADRFRYPVLELDRINKTGTERD